MLGVDPTGKIEFYSFIWLGLLILTLAGTSRPLHSSVGLPFAFIMSYTVAHCGAVLYLLNYYDPEVSAYLVQVGFTRENVALGLEASCLAMTSAVVGGLIAGAWILGGERGVEADRPTPSSLRSGSLILLGLSLTVLVASVALGRMGEYLPDLQAIVMTLRNFFVPGACGLILYHYVVRGQRRPLVIALATMVVTPALLLVTTAILADSVTMAIIIASFLFSLPTPRANTFVRNLTILVALLVCGFVFSIFYMSARGPLRGVVWQGGSVQSATESIAASGEGFRAGLSLTSDALVLIDSRMDQNAFVGMSIKYLKEHPTLYADGATIGNALVGWVPRLFWPNKPTRGGSAFLAQYTGRYYGEGTTMGTGPIFELFVNFGYMGIIFGFLVLGMLVRLIDVAAYRALHSGDLARFAQYMCVGMAFMDPLGVLTFLVAAVVTAFLVGWVLRSLWQPRISSSEASYMASST